MIDKFTNLLNSFIRFHEKLGIKYITMYLIYTLILVSALNWKSLVIGVSEVIDSHKKEKHIEMIKERDEINMEMYDIITDLRRSIRASRVMVFEFHNTVANVSGIPFKFMSITCNSEGRKVEPTNILKYGSLNTGLLASFLQDLKKNVYIEIKDIEKNCEYYNIRNLLYEDKAKNAVAHELIGIGGIPLGFILVEWIDYESDELNWSFTRSEMDKASQSLNILMADSKKL